MSSEVGLPPGGEIEIRNPEIARGRIRFALFDFDGTLSLIREGWQRVMIPMMTEVLSTTPQAEETAAIEAVVNEFVTRLTGRQTIYQMMQLCEEVEKRGGRPEEPLWYKQRYLERLWQRIQTRVEGLGDGRAAPHEFLLPGALKLLDALRQRGIAMYLASGTDLPDVQREAALLGTTDYFNGHIYGALEDYESFSKERIIRQILDEHALRGEALVVFGDGYVEIENAKAVGGIAVGVASDEASGVAIDAWKRDRLIAAGADLIVPNFVQWRRLLTYLFAEEDA